MQYSPCLLTDEELEARFQSLREETEKAKDEFDAKFWSQLQKRMTERVSSKIYLFTECLRIVSELERDALRKPSQQSQLDPSWRRQDYDLLIREAEILFQKAFYSRALISDGSDQVAAAIHSGHSSMQKELDELQLERIRRSKAAADRAAELPGKSNP